MNAKEAREVAREWCQRKEDRDLSHMGDVLSRHLVDDMAVRNRRRIVEENNTAKKTPFIEKEACKRIISHAQAIAEALEAEED